MKNSKTYYCDWRLANVCAYCGDHADTEDHVPSKCFLDSPLPSELPVVPCCHHCNEQFSHDEEYVSCMIDCMKQGTTDVQSIHRDKTRATLTHSKGLAEKLKHYAGQDFYGTHFGTVEGLTIRLPEEHLPNPLFLEWHRDCVFNK